ncbi:hypothetical protein A5731_22645 [Mycolicibacterium conceptionense]|uniref:hypothetical protein n=1 Tax=Mycolicibacterium conceptionense TaxID=451644 RepID=UPI0007EA1CD0|nr:hypothetical protein [Mycolicibacterium conceptionense]OBE98498.1 hypothetical protein A5731_22645 [Mycolicibacterium conceptionense]
MKIHDGGLRLGDSPAISLGRDDSKYLARVLLGMLEAGKDATVSTVLTQRSPIVVTPLQPSGVTLTRGKTTHTLTGRECLLITKAFG